MRLALIHNRNAGDQEYTTQDIIQALRRHGHQPVELKGRALERFHQGNMSVVPGEIVVVIGGDGSVKRAALALAGSGLPLAIIPLGTANNIAKSLGLEGSPRDLIRLWGK